MSSYFPLFMNIEQKRFRVFGAGEVAARRIGALLSHGAFVTVAAPQIKEEITALQQQYGQKLQIEQRPYRLSEIQDDNADYVLAATNDKQVNTTIFRECRHKGIPVNDASNREQCDFYFPALIELEQEQLFAAVISTDGDAKKAADFSEKLRQGRMA